MGADAAGRPFSPYLHRGADLRAAYEAGDPFPLLVLDDFLAPDLAAALLDEFPSIDDMPRSRDYVFGRKHELSSVAGHGPACAEFYAACLSPEFATFLAEATGHALFVDPAFHGGGFHQGGDGSYLDMHVDFNVHPQHRDWQRMLNILVYLNPAWQPRHGGELVVRAGKDGAERAIEPLFNRAVIMLTGDTTFHGYRRTTLPPGVTRRSIATYAYRKVPPGSVRPRTTGWHPDDAGVGKRLLARHYDRLVRAKNRLFGSGTARNR